MSEPQTKLATQLERLLERFTEERPVLRPPAGEAAWEPLAERFPNGHCRRWFEACDGQDTAYAFYDAHELMKLSEAVDCMRIADDAVQAEVHRRRSGEAAAPYAADETAVVAPAGLRAWRR